MAKPKRSTPEATSASKLDRSPPWNIVYYAEPDGAAPALQFLDGCPTKVEALLRARARDGRRLFKQAIGRGDISLDVCADTTRASTKWTVRR